MYDNNPQEMGTSSGAPKYFKAVQPYPTKEELLNRNSFGSVNDNKYLDKMIGGKK